MRAATFYTYGSPDVFQIEDRPDPIPGEKELLIRVHAAALNSADVRLMKADPFLVRFFFGFLKPKFNVLGTTFSGVVESVGPEVTGFQPGDELFGTTGAERLGCHAEFITIPQDGIITTKSSNISHEEASAIFFGGHTALHFLKKGEVSEGQKVLIYGASGAVGTSAVQLAKYFRAEVYGVCSTRNVDMVSSLGADRVFDYTQEDFSSSGIKFDIIFDTVGKSPFGKCVKSLKNNGRYLRTVHMSPGPMLKGIWTQITSNKKVIGGVADESLEALLFLSQLARDGQLTPPIDKTFPLENIRDAYAYVDKGHKSGNVVIKTI